MKKNSFLLSILFAVTALLVYSCNGGGYGSTSPGGTGGTPSTGATDSIKISSFQYIPNIDTVHVGVPLTWKNNDPYNHTATSDDGTTFSSGTIAPGGGVFTFTPSTAGTFTYHDAVYPTTVGKLVVKP
jgi:plastocyanin